MTTEAGAGTGAASAAGAAAGAAAAGTAAGAAGAGAAAPAWHGYTDAADTTYVANKGWQGAQDVVRSYREAERLIGRDPTSLITVPRADDPNGFITAMDRLGRPADPAKYEFHKAQGAQPDANFEAWARPAFHKLGLTVGQGKDLTAAYAAFQADAQAKQLADYNTSVAGDKQALLREWAGGHERKMNAAKSAVNALGIPGDMLDAIESHIGYAKTYKLFAGLAERMSEDTLVTADAAGNKRFSGEFTPDEAKAQWEASKLDPNFLAALKDKNHPGHAGAQKKQSDLFRIMYPAA